MFWRLLWVVLCVRNAEGAPGRVACSLMEGESVLG